MNSVIPIVTENIFLQTWHYWLSLSQKHENWWIFIKWFLKLLTASFLFMIKLQYISSKFLYGFTSTETVTCFLIQAFTWTHFMNNQQSSAQTQLLMEWLTHRRAFRTTLYKSENINQHKVLKNLCVKVVHPFVN